MSRKVIEEMVKDVVETHEPGYNRRAERKDSMTMFEELCASLNVKQESKYEIVVSNMVNDLIFNENRAYTDEEINRIVTKNFRKLFPYI